MKLSTKARYGTRALLELALHQKEEPMALKDIAKRQQISLSYLEHLIAPLIAGQIIRSTKGPKGGISLTRPLEEITLSEIVQLLEGSVAPVDCVNDATLCNRADSCVTRDIWRELKTAVDSILQSTTLKDLAERHQQKEKTEPLMYYI